MRPLLVRIVLLALVACDEAPAVPTPEVVCQRHAVLEKEYGLAILGRASQKQVVNVAQRGGMCSVMVGRAPVRLIGPGTA